MRRKLLVAVTDRHDSVEKVPLEAALVEAVRPQVRPVTRAIGEDPNIDRGHVMQADHLVTLSTIA